MLTKSFYSGLNIGIRGVATFYGKPLIIEKANKLKPKKPEKDLKFGDTFTDHMLEIDYDINSGWGSPKIREYGPLQLLPSVSCLHYANQCYEGMKAYLDPKGKIRLFRPELNMARFQRSMDRLALPKYDQEGFLKCIIENIKLDRSWMPKSEGYTLYIRPLALGTREPLGLASSEKCKLISIFSPVGPYHATGFKPISLLAETHYVRAWPGGTGNVKVGGNYGCSILAQKECEKVGINQTLWLFGDDRKVTEAGAMNMMFFLKNKKGQRELVTASLNDGTVLPGITRQSLLELAKNMKKEVDLISERDITMAEVSEACLDGRMIEGFCAGTAAIISPVKSISYEGKTYNIPTGSNGLGPLSEKLLKQLMDIQFGKIDHPWSVVID